MTALTVLSSPRLYTTAAEPDVRLLHVWHLGRAPIGGVTSSAKLPLLGGLGETAVDFDFAPPVQVSIIIPFGRGKTSSTNFPDPDFSPR